MFSHRVCWFAVLAALGCSASRRAAEAPPKGEFLLSAADSTFWVSTTTGHLRVRGVPLLLTRYNGRYYELYTADDDRSYDDALLVGARLYSRDLLSGDSTMVFADSIVPRVAEAYAHAHPNERPLGPNDDGSDRPGTTATAEVDVLDVTGPYLSFEYHVDLDLPRQRSWHTSRRGVLDLRSGRERLVADVFGAAESRRLTQAGRRIYETTRDSIIRAHSTMSDGDRRAAAVLRGLQFDERSFSLSTVDGQPAVTFSVPGATEAGSDDAVELDPLQVHDAGWWHGVKGSIATTDAAGNDRWKGAGYDVIARYDTTGDIASVAIADSSKREWPVADVGGPLRDIYWLDRPAVSGASRSALIRAFDQAATYDEHARVALGGATSNPATSNPATSNPATSNLATSNPAPSNPAPSNPAPSKSAASTLSLVSSHAAHQDRLRKPARNVGADDARARQQYGSRVRRRRVVDNGQVRRHRGLSPLPKRRGDRID
jgi:hypothetical protein